MTTAAQKARALTVAGQNLDRLGIGISPPITAPTIQFKHMDGPLLHRLDGRMHWLTWRERFSVWRGRADAWSIEIACQAKEQSQ